MEQGPVLILTFAAQQIMCAVDARGKVIEGGEVCDRCLCTDNGHGWWWWWRGLVAVLWCLVVILMMVVGGRTTPCNNL